MPYTNPMGMGSALRVYEYIKVGEFNPFEIKNISIDFGSTPHPDSSHHHDDWKRFLGNL